jgi:tetratricopeptide (TPR) repeat protein
LGSKANSFHELGKFQEAIVWYDKALAIDPKNVDVLTAKGLTLYNLQKYQEAIVWIDKALAIDPDNAYALERKK